MIATYNQVTLEMRTKETEFARELQRAQYTESRMLHLVAKLVKKVQVRVGRVPAA